MTTSKDNYATLSPRDTVIAIQQDLTRKTQEMRARLKALVKSLPKASSEVSCLTGTACCGTVSYSTISSHLSILSPSYYLTGNAVDLLEHLIDTESILTLDKKIQEILNTGKLHMGVRYAPPLNNEFIEALRLAWEGDRS